MSLARGYPIPNFPATANSPPQEMAETQVEIEQSELTMGGYEFEPHRSKSNV
jgi:hypothetical protein